MMRVLTTISYYAPHISGLTICAQRLMTALTERGFSFVVLTSASSGAQPGKGEQNKVMVRRVPVWVTLGKVPIMPRYPLELWREIRKTELIWIHLPQAEGILTASLAKLTRKPVVTTMHCLPLLPSGWQRLLFQGLFDFLNNVVIRMSDQVVYTSRDYAENTKELLHVSDKSHYIYLPVLGTKDKEQKPAYPPRRIDASRAGKAESKELFVVGFVGRISEDKGLEYLIEALEILKERGYQTKLKIVGPSAVGESKYQQKIHNLVSRVSIDVDFLRQLSEVELSRFYGLIDCLVLPSINRTEAFGLVQVEAMMQGVPVVASDLPGVRVPVQLTKGGVVVPPREVRQLADGILKVADSYQTEVERKSIGEKARTNFSLKKTVDAYESVLSTLGQGRVTGSFGRE